MSLDQLTFLTSINLSYCNYIELHLDRRGITREDFMYDLYIIVYLRMYIIMLNAFFSISTLDDINICTEEEIQFALDQANEIMGTYYTVDFEITDLTEVSNFWDDSLIWSDSNIWVD
jgi:hypothetical protein